MRRKGAVGRQFRGPRVLTPMAQSRLRAVRKESERSDKSIPSRKHSRAEGLIGGREEIQRSRTLRPRR